MTERPKRRREGRRRSKGDEAPLFLLTAVTVLLVLIGFFLRADASVAPPVAKTDTAVTSGSTGAGSGSTTTTTVAPLIHPVRDPIRIVIPVIGVDAKIVPVGLSKGGEIETPPWGIAGWYSLGPTPGSPGPALVLAHVDSVHGRDVFYHLRDVEQGDEVFVYGSDGGAAAVFVVDSVETQLKAELPRERIWVYSKDALIRLITCGGRFDHRWGHYLSNVIVYGHLAR
jgi:hypothetical protein